MPGRQGWSWHGEANAVCLGFRTADMVQATEGALLAVVIRQNEQTAWAIAERSAELLCTRTWVTDEHGVVVACSDRRCLGHAFAFEIEDAAVDYLRVALTVGAQHGEVIVALADNGENISPRLARVLVELVINQAVVVAQLPNRQELKNKFIHDLLRGRVDDEEDIIREGQILGMDLTIPRAVILLDAADYMLAADEVAVPVRGDDYIPRRMQYIIASIVSFFNLPNDTICASIGSGEVAILKAATTQDLVSWTDYSDEQLPISASWTNLNALKRASNALLARLTHELNAAITIGIGRYHPGIRGLSRSYRDARAALSLGSRLQGHNRVHCLDSLGMAAFIGISDEQTKQELAAHLLSPLDSEPELHDTLDAFFIENCSASSTASRLCIHRNTLSYRLDKIASLTGLDPRTFDDAVQIRLALLLRSLQGQPA